MSCKLVRVGGKRHSDLLYSYLDASSATIQRDRHSDRLHARECLGVIA